MSELVRSDPWGRHQPPAETGPVAPLPPRLARLAAVQATRVALTTEDPYANDSPAAAELPEVQLLMAQGWRALNGAPLYCLLPAAWPPEHRTWIPDRLPRVGIGRTTDNYWGAISPPPPDDEDWPDDHVGEQARAVGLPDPPPDRIWLLRSPWPRIPVSVIYALVWSVVAGSGRSDEIAQMYRVALDVLTWDEERALAACPADVHRLLDEWARAGRVGEAAAAAVEQRLRPGDLDEALRATGLDEPALFAWITSLGGDLDAAAIRFISAWRSSGLPGNPPPGASRFTHRDTAELQSWLDAGFDLHAAAELELAGLDAATRWRAAGFDEAETYELLRSDPAFTPEQAQAFDGVGPARERRREWIYYGFTATQAGDWATAGLTPAQARLWRACDQQPADVQPGQRIPAQLTEGRRYVALSGSQWDDLDDPPGTPGRRARRWAGDADPWINTD